MRKGEIFFDAITNVRDDLVEAVQDFHLSGWGGRIRRYAPLAAALILVVGIGAFLASGGLRMGGASSTNGSTTDNSATAGDSGGDSGNTGATMDGAGDPESAGNGPTFSDTTGPILPLALQKQNDAITAERVVELDFDGYGEQTEFWEDRYRIGVLDRYTLTNSADTAQTATILYPVAGALGELDTPDITVDGGTVEISAAVGTDADLETDAVWQAWESILEDTDYRTDALNGPTDLSGMTAVVYTVSDQYGPAGEDGATLALEFSYDPAVTTVMQYGFDGGSTGDGGVVKYSGSGFVRQESEDWFLIVLGEDVENPHLQGYQNGACNSGEELSGVGGTLTRTETTLEEILRTVAEDYWARQCQRGSMKLDVPFDAFYAAVADSVLTDTQYLPLLEEFLFAQVWQSDRVVWFTGEVTIPAGGSVQVDVAYTKAACLNFGPSDMPYKDLCGYGILTQAGSNLTFTGQTAQVVNGEEVTCWEGSADQSNTLSFGETVMYAGEGVPTREYYVLYAYQ